MPTGVFRWRLPWIGKLSSGCSETPARSMRPCACGKCCRRLRGRSSGPVTLQELPYIGPVLARHLARNTGWEVAKDDVHLARLRSRFGFWDAQEMCEAGARILGQPVGAVDYALWRYCADYGRAEGGSAARREPCQAPRHRRLGGGNLPNMHGKGPTT